MHRLTDLRTFTLVLAVPLALAGCNDGDLPTGPTAALPAFSQAAASPVVNSLLDDGTGCTAAKCTLRDAIAYADAGATITFDPGLTAGGPAVVGLTAGDLLIGKNLTIAGPGSDLLQVRRSVDATFRIFTIAEAATVHISGLALTNGSFWWGGAINNAGTLHLSWTTIANNRGTHLGVGENGGGLFNTGTMTISHSVIADNAANAGAAMVNDGSLTITNSTITGNVGISATLTGGGTTVISHSTISHNHASVNGAVFTNVTVRNTIIAANGQQNCLVIPVDGGHNLEDGNSCGFTAPSSRSDTNPLLGVLQPNGGPTWTRALLAGSPAIDAGTCTDPVVNTDQRGFARPFGSACDIGAFEYGSSTPPLPPPACTGVEIRMVRTSGPDPAAAGAAGAWTVTLEVTACEDVTGVVAQGGTPAWADTQPSAGIGVRRTNKNNTVLLWEIGSMKAGDVATASLAVTGTVAKKTPCGTPVQLTGEWSATADAGAGPVKFDSARPLTVLVGC